jgi:hypothetical protein
MFMSLDCFAFRAVENEFCSAVIAVFFLFEVGGDGTVVWMYFLPVFMPLDKAGGI